MAAVAEPAFLSEQARKEEKNMRREARNRELEEQKRKTKDEEERQRREKELQVIANFRNNGHNNKQVPRIPVKPVVEPQPQAPKVPAKPAQAPLPAAPTTAPTRTAVPTSTTQASTVQPAPVAPAKAAVPSLPKASTVSNISHYQQQSATTRSTEITFYVGKIQVKSTASNIMFGRKETRATTVENYTSAFQHKGTEGQKNLATSVSVTTSVTTTLPVVPQTNQPAKAVVPQTNQPAKAAVPQTNQPAKAVVVPQTNQPAKEKVVAPATKTTKGQKGPARSYYRNSNGPDQNYRNGRVANGGGNGPNQKYYGNDNGSIVGQRYNGNCYGQGYNGNGQKYYEVQKKHARPKPVIDAEGWQLVQNRKRVY